MRCRVRVYLSLEALYQTHPSRPRNRLVASAFYRAALIERWGTGTLRIVKACEERGMSRPEFKIQSGVFIVRLVSKGIESHKSKVAGLTQRQRKTLEYVSEHGAITSAEFQKIFGVSERQARRDLAGLVALTRLGEVGKGPSRR